MRFGPRQLDESIEEYNARLAQKGILIRFVSGGRNGYQAVDEYSVDEYSVDEYSVDEYSVDEYSVDEFGQRIGSGVNCNVAYGTSREVSQACELRMYQLLAAQSA